MKTRDKTPAGAAVAVAAAALAVYGGGMLLFVKQMVRPMIVLGGGICLIAAALVVVLYILASQAERREEELLDELIELKEDHEKEMRRSIVASREDMEQFRNSLAHSLRMPVSIVRGYAELLAGGMVNSEQTRQEYLEKILQCSADLTEVVDRHFSASDAVDSQSLSYGELDLLELVSRVAADMHLAAEEKGVHIQVLTAEETMPMQADAYQINRMMFNLLENALKYMGRPGIVTIRLLRQEANYTIVVQDDGLGLPAQEAARVFEPRYQGSNKTGGRGYGLFQVAQTAQAHGGSASARSELGQGMGVSVTIPVKPREAVAAG